MGDVQSTQQGSRQDGAAGEDSREEDNPQIEQNTEHEIFRKSELTSDISRKGDKVKINGCCEDENGAQGLTLSPTKDAAPETQVNGESPGEVHANDDMHLQITQMDVKQNNINAFGRFFSNIGLKLTINRGSTEKARDESKTNTEAAEETKTEMTEDKTERTTEQQRWDTACPLLTDVTSENVAENADKTAETTEEPEYKPETVTDTQKEEPPSTNSTGPGDVEIDSPVRRFFTTGIFAGLWKKKEPGDETTERELEEMGGNQVLEITGQVVEERDEGVSSPGAAGEAEQKENELRDETPGKSPEHDISGSQERDRVQMSPLLRFLSGSSLKRLSMKQRSIKSSEARLCDSGEQSPELLPSEPAEGHRNASAPTSVEAAKEEDSAWASFKRFMAPKPRMKKSYNSAEETQQPASVEEPKAEQTSDHSLEEGKKRKNSSVSWEAVLCGSGRRRSRKTSDSDEEMPPIDLKSRKEDGRPKSGEESGAENEKDTSSSSKQDEASQEDDGGSTWKSLKRIVTPKRKSRDEEEGVKIKNQSDGEGAQENSSFSIMNLLPGRKKQKSEESQGRDSPEEAEKDEASDDEDSETPGVVPLSEFEVNEEEKESSEEEKTVELQQDQVANANLYFPQDFDENSEKQEDTTETDFSKLQPLSDIQEEGAITEPGATLASAAEELEGRDDTVAEDLIEVVSEVVTVPEAAGDVTLQDETEMFTAVSQFSSESAKTSGNATPVPAESDIIETETFLHQVAETFSTRGKMTSPEPTILEMNRRPDAASTETGLKVEDVEALSGLVSSSLREDLSGVFKLNSEGFVSEVVTEELDTAEASLDDVHVISVTQECMKEDEKQFPVSPVEQGEIKSELATENRDLEQEVQTLRENDDISDHTEVEDEEKQAVEEKEEKEEKEDVQDVAKELADALATEGGVEAGEEEIREASAEMQPLAEANVGAENAEQQKQEHQEPEEAEGPVELEPEVISDDISMCLGTELSGDQPEVETGLLTEVILDQLDAYRSVEEASSLKVEESCMSSQTQLLTETFESSEGPQELEILRSVQEVSSSSNIGEVINVFLETEVIRENISKKERVEDEPRRETTETDYDGHDVHKTAEEPDVSQLYEDSLQQIEASRTAEEPEVLQAVSSLAPDKDDPESVETQEKTPKEIVVDGIKKETIIIEDTLQSVEASRTTEEPEVMKTELDDAQNVEEAELSPTVQSPFEEISVSSLEAEETSENLPKAEAVPDESKEERTFYPEDTETAEELEAVRAVCPPPEHPSLEKEATCDDHVSEEERVPDEPNEETMISDINLQSLDPSEAVEEAEVLKVLHHSSESEETKEKTCEVTEEEAVSDEPRDEATVGETITEPVDESKSYEVIEELYTLEPSSMVKEESSISPYEPEETSENNITAEADKDENREETMLHTEYSIESEDAARVPQEPEELKPVLEAESQTLLKEKTAPDGDLTSIVTESGLEEKDYLKTVQTFWFVSEEISTPTLDSEESSEIILKADLYTDDYKSQTTLFTEDSPEPLDDAQNVEEVELSPTVQSPFEEINVSSREAEETSENLPKAEAVPDESKEERTFYPEDTETAEELEAVRAVCPPPEHPSLEKETTCDDHVSEEERVPDEPKEETMISDTNLQSLDPSEAVEEAEVLKVLHHSSESEETKEETCEVTEEEAVADEPRDEATVVGETITEPVDGSKSEESSIPPLKAEEPPENIHKVESDTDEHKVETVLVTEEPELIQIMQVSSLESEDNSITIAEAEITSEIILKEERVPDGFKEELRLYSEVSIEPEDPSEAVGEAEVLKDVHLKSLESEETKEETSNVTEEETVPDEPRDEATVVGETITEPEDESKTDGVTEELYTLEPSSTVREESSIPSVDPQEPFEIIVMADLNTDEQKSQTTLFTEDSPEPLDDAQNVEEAELSPTVQSPCEEISVSSLEAEETSENLPKAEAVPDESKEERTFYPEDTETTEELEAVRAVCPPPEHPSLEKEATCDDHVSEEERVPDEPKEETMISDTNLQSLDPSEAVEEAEVLKVLHHSSESEETKEKTCEVTEEEAVSDEPRDEATVGETITVDESKSYEVIEELYTLEPSSMVREESSISPYEPEETSENILKAESDTDEDKVLTEDTSEPKTAEEPELSQTVQQTSVESEDNNIPSAGPQITSEIILKEETVADEHREEESVAGQTSSEPVDESNSAEVVEELHLYTSLVKYKSSSQEAEETTEKISKAEEGVTLDPEDTETVDNPEALRPVHPPAESEHPSKETTCDHSSFPDEPKEETITETMKSVEEPEVQDVTVALVDSEELEVNPNIDAGAGTDTVIVPEVHLQPVDVQELEVSKATTLESREEAQETSRNIPQAETHPEEEDLTVETTTDDLHLQHEIYLVRPVEEAEREPAAEVPSDKCESEGQVVEASEQKQTVPQDVQGEQEDSTPEEFYSLTAGQTSEESVVSDEARHEEHLSEEQVATQQVKEDRHSRTEMETVEDEESSAPQMVKVVDPKSEETNVDSLLEVEEMEAGGLSASTEMKKEGNLEEDEAESQDRKLQVGPEEVTEEHLHVDSRERETAERESDRTELQAVVEGSPGFEDKELYSTSSEQVESNVAMETPEVPGRLESSIPEEALEGCGKNNDEVKDKEGTSVQATEAFQSPPATKKVDQVEFTDAERNMDVQEETAGCLYEAQRPLESQRRDEDVEQEGLEREAGSAHASTTEGEGSEEKNKADEACGFENDDEDFDVALQHPGNMSVTTVSLTG